jgi:hypothetical protein
MPPLFSGSLFLLHPIVKPDLDDGAPVNANLVPYVWVRGVNFHPVLVRTKPFGSFEVNAVLFFIGNDF